MQDDPDLWPCRSMVSINLPFPVKGSIFATRFCAGVGNNSVVFERSQRSWARSHGWTANSVPHSVFSRNPTGYTPSTWPQGWVFWCSRKLLCMIPWLEICNKGPKSIGSISGCCLPGSRSPSWKEKPISEWWLSLQAEALLTRMVPLRKDLPQGRCGWTWSLFSCILHYLSNMEKTFHCHCKWLQPSTKPSIKKMTPGYQSSWQVLQNWPL